VRLTVGGDKARGREKQRRGRPRAILVGVAFILGGAAIAATFYGQSQVIAARDADTKHRHDIREAFGEFISRGREIEKKIADTASQSPIQDKNIWE
jgi:hypothetical protein